jgi:preprotein translocase subunit SecG
VVVVVVMVVVVVVVAVVAVIVVASATREEMEAVGMGGVMGAEVAVAVLSVAVQWQGQQLLLPPLVVVVVAEAGDRIRGESQEVATKL